MSFDGMGRSRAALTGALIGAVISGALIDLARGADRVECELQRVNGDGQHWAYRIVDGRECWYPGRPGKPKNELFWNSGVATSARQPVVPPEAETEPSEPSPNFVAAPPQQPDTTEAVPEQWHAATADQLLAFTCCWPELEEPAQAPKPPPEPPAWPLALLPLGLYPLWWIVRPRRGLRAVRHGGRVAAHSPARLHRQNGFGGRREASRPAREGRSVRPHDEQLSPLRQCSTGLGQNPRSLFVLPINEQQHVSFRSLVDAPDPIARPASAVDSLLGELPGLIDPEDITLW